MSNRYKDKRKVAVSIIGATARYGFLTNLATADSAALGHEELDEDGTGGTGVVFFGASRPKPPRAKKVSDGTTSYYTLGLAPGGGLPAGWIKVTPAKNFPFPRSSAKSKLVYVDIQGGKYAWNMPLETYTKVADAKTALGITDVAANDKCFIGVNSITNTDAGKLGKPKRAFKEFAGEDGVDRVSTFAQYPAPETLPEGWSI